MNNLIPFNFENHEIRTVVDNGEMWVVAKDVCEALEYKWRPNLIGRVPDKWKGINPISTPGGTQGMAVLSEQGLYFFLGRSDKPKALPLQMWIAGEVLPSIRKTGRYGLSNTQLPDFTNPAEAARAWAIEYEKRQKAEEEVQKLNTIIDNEFGYCSILRASVFLGVHESTFNWRPLKAMSIKLGLPPKKVPSPRYGYQNLYPIKAFEQVYPDYDFDDLTPEYVEDKAKLALTH